MESTASPPCPFCNIASAYPPIRFNDPESNPTSTIPESGPLSHIILSTEHVLAFLDIMPLTRGHVLVAPRNHHQTLGDMGVRAGQEIGKWLPILSRVVTKSVFGNDPDRHWNVVQNNGERAAQVVPHVHFHIIPRPALGSNQRTSFAMFGRGQREELDDDEGEALAREMRLELVEEVERIQRDEGIDLAQDLIPVGSQRGKL
ncbi:Histidine triad (HIT) protein [Penicillium paradoxum]|uniref:Histidine triad (HIT) protein n=1 Tax=Penicillium paradoxum TaxID=176176 RepID=UPI002546BC27|nr:Histidine triad (HIT) protein [Penicillium paradoxum]KAJ5779466.1 Histidine triad (HIT) protein [Penicillium paradoxum]